MKKTNKQVLANTIGSKQYSIKGANLLITEIKTPAPLLHFLNESLWWVQQFDEDRKTQPDNFDLRMIIENIVQPWVSGGNDVHKIAKGLEELVGAIGYEGYENFLSKTIQAFGLNIKEGLYVDIDSYLRIIGTLMKLCSFMSDYEYAKREEYKLSKVA